MGSVDWNARSYSQEEFVKAFNESTNWGDLAEKLGLCNRKGMAKRSLEKAAISLGLDTSSMAGVSGRKRKYDEEMLISAVANSFSISGVLRELGLKPVGGNISHIGRRIKEYGIDTSHFTGQAHNKGKILAQPVNPIDILVLGTPLDNRVKSKKLRKCLELLGVDEVCNQCGLGTEWNGKPIVLEINHINGNYWDNRKVNLEFLCPNCHSQETETNRPHKYRDNRQDV